VLRVLGVCSCSLDAGQLSRRSSSALSNELFSALCPELLLPSGYVALADLPKTAHARGTVLEAAVALAHEAAEAETPGAGRELLSLVATTLLDRARVRRASLLLRKLGGQVTCTSEAPFSATARLPPHEAAGESGVSAMLAESQASAAVLAMAGITEEVLLGRRAMQEEEGGLESESESERSDAEPRWRRLRDARRRDRDVARRSGQRGVRKAVSDYLALEGLS
jgi:hypothetical protein